jgi:hypothetical protein
LNGGVIGNPHHGEPHLLVSNVWLLSFAGTYQYLDFTLTGQTPFDIKYFQATKLRINSENANMIVDVVKPPRKKAKVE